jgi:hypothetical protein
MNVEMNSWQLVRKLPWPKDRRYPWLKVPTPTIRALQVCAFDPSTGGYAGKSRPSMCLGRSSRQVHPAARSSTMPPPISAIIRPSISTIRFCWRTTASILLNPIPASTKDGLCERFPNYPDFETALGRDIHWRRMWTNLIQIRMEASSTKAAKLSISLS